MFEEFEKIIEVEIFRKYSWIQTKSNKNVHFYANHSITHTNAFLYFHNQMMINFYNVP